MSSSSLIRARIHHVKASTIQFQTEKTFHDQEMMHLRKLLEELKETRRGISASISQFRHLESSLSEREELCEALCDNSDEVLASAVRLQQLQELRHDIEHEYRSIDKMLKSEEDSSSDDEERGQEFKPLCSNCRFTIQKLFAKLPATPFSK
jgi:chromosome segregation ATPase